MGTHERGIQQKPGVRERVLEAVLFSLPLFIASIFFKLSYLRHGGRDVLQASLGLSSLSLIDYSRLFASEVVESLFVFPLLLLFAGVFVGARWRPWVYFACVEVVLLVGAIAWLVAYFTIGRLPTLELVREFLQAYRTNPDFVAPSAVLAAGLLVLMGLILSLGVIPLLLLRSRRFRAVCPQTLRGIIVPLAMVLVPAQALKATTTTVSLYHVGGFQRLVRELLRSDAPSLPDEAELTVPALEERYDKVVFPEGRAAGAGIAGTASPVGQHDPNVIFIVLETASARDYPLSRMPNVAKLFPHSLVAQRHYSTDPYSIRANFTIYSSVYDLRGPMAFSNYVLGRKPRPLDALPRLLHERGYATRYYFPHALWPEHFEASQLRYLGFDEIYLYGFSTEDGRTPPERNAHAERAVYQRVREDLEALHAQGRPFFFALANSIGHAPHFDIRPQEVIDRDPHPPREVLVANISALMDELIGTLIDELRALNILDDTILVITGDHGPRNKVDDATLDTRYCNDQTYHVPLLIHYPRAFEQPVVIDHVTSHVDLVPTVMNLMGVDASAYLHQGLPMFDRALEDRVTFFLGDHYTGCDALHYKGNFFMVNGLTQATYLGDRFLFSRENLLSASTDPGIAEEGRFFKAALAGLTESTWACIAYVLAPHDGDAPQERARGVVHTFLAKDDKDTGRP